MRDECELASYGEMAQTIVDLPSLVREKRRRRRLSLRAAGDEVGVAASTLSRLEAGEDVAQGVLLALLRWLDDGPSSSVRDRPSRITSSGEEPTDA